MTYELAKQLEKAGFPQDNYPCEILLQENKKEGKMEKVSVPTLSELIEAVGDKFDKVQRNKKYGQPWLACVVEDKDKKCAIGLGYTPEEAVAKLYIALKTK